MQTFSNKTATAPETNPSSGNNWRKILKSQFLDEISNESFQERRKILLKVINETINLEAMIIKAKPKRNHQNLNTDGFRGSSYRGVSKNKSKWQVTFLHSS